MVALEHHLDIADREVLLTTEFGKAGGRNDDIVDEFVCDREEDLRRGEGSSVSGMLFST